MNTHINSFICECCGEPHAGNYGSGRFCSNSCARCFSTKNKRQDINKKVSETAKENYKNGITSGWHTDTARKKRKETLLEKYGTSNTFSLKEEKCVEGRRRGGVKRGEQRRQEALNRPFEEMSYYYKKKILLNECGNKCSFCGEKEWFGTALPLEIHHINGVHSDNRKQNLQILCPNCHSITSNWKGKNIKKAI